jgi:ribosomal protein L16/L10AE
MITVTILINGNAIYTRTAVNRNTQPSGFDKYELDDGRAVLHLRSEGAVSLAIRMLAEIREQDVESARIAAAKDNALRKWKKVTSRFTPKNL